MDTLGFQFFWRGGCDKFKYHMVKRENLCLPKYYGGLGFISTRFMNEALLLKWVRRVYNCDKDDMCCNLLKAKYLSNKSFAHNTGTEGSQFGE